jgi:hypothetical protein
MAVAATAAPSRRRSLVHRTTTAVLVTESVVGGGMDLLRLPPFFPVLQHLGYPDYFAEILGVAKLLAAGAILAPGLARSGRLARVPERGWLTEWAYAGVVFTFVGAGVSHLAAGDGPTATIAPAAFLAATVTSWASRPRTPGGGPPGSA